MNQAFVIEAEAVEDSYWVEDAAAGKDDGGSNAGEGVFIDGRKLWQIIVFLEGAGDPGYARKGDQAGGTGS